LPHSIMVSGLNVFMTEQLSNLLWTSPKKYTTDSAFMLHTETLSFLCKCHECTRGLEKYPHYTTKNTQKLISFHNKYGTKS
jgi:hypothetical protein